MPPPNDPNEYTVEEARALWCPMTQLMQWGGVPAQGIISNRGSAMDRSTLRSFADGVPTEAATDRMKNMMSCQADTCMWWFWTTKNDPNPKGRCGAACCPK